jgi:Fur family ferric uptake transcriptional regulator
MIRQTRQREVIREVLESAGRPLTPQELYELARERFPRLGLRTVYRQLKDLVESGDIVGLDYPGQPLRYGVVTGRHVAHFICRKCNKLYSLPHEVADVPEPPEPRFRFEGQETVFYGEGRGLCELCPVSGGSVSTQ